LSTILKLRTLKSWISRKVITDDFDRLFKACVYLFFCIGAGVVLYFCFREEADYAIKLSVWFVFWLSMFHCYYAVKQVTTREARKIDYWYLSIAAIGVLFFAIGYSDQRLDYLGQFERGMVESNADGAVSHVKYVAGEYLNIACNLSDSQATTEADCDRAQEMFRSSRKPLTASTMAQLGVDFSKVYEAEKEKGVVGYQKRVDGFSRDELLRTMGRVQSAIEDAVERMKRNDSMPAWQPPPKQGRDTYKVLLGLGQVVLWPFILALALALRITKVTIEVERWAKD